MTNPPGPLLQKINAILHQQPYSIIFHGCFWHVILFLGAPFVGAFMVVITIAELIFHYTINSQIQPKNIQDKELAVMITGCDSGFGHELAFRMSGEGYTVFCGCLKTESMPQFEQDPKCIPIKLDVTKVDDVAKCFMVVDKWLNESSSKNDVSSKRILYGLINNAGISIGGFVDWADISSYQRVMDVNCFGMIRMVKAFLPIFKCQAVDQNDCNMGQDCRIINMISAVAITSGIGIGSSLYETSKHAAEAFTDTLRQEMKMFHVKVISINPSFHSTPLIEEAPFVLRAAWNKLTSEKQAEYGQDFLKARETRLNNQTTSLLWDYGVVVDVMMEAVNAKYPRTQIIVGTDARIVLGILRMLPQWAQGKVIGMATPLATPAFLKQQ